MASEAVDGSLNSAKSTYIVESALISADPCEHLQCGSNEKNILRVLLTESNHVSHNGMGEYILDTAFIT
jgi:hypothetical protein